MSSAPDLVIAITSFKRQSNLEYTLDSIAIPHTAKVDLVLLGEPGLPGIPHKSSPIYSKFSQVNIIEASYQYGCDLSILKVLELSTYAPYIYLLGDSKPLYPDAITQILSDISHYQKPSFLNYIYDSKNVDTSTIKSLSSLVASGLSFGDFILAGNTVFECSAVRSYLAHAYMVLPSRIAHVSIPIMLLKDGKPIHVINHRLIGNFLDKPPSTEPNLEWANCIAKFSLITLLPLPRRWRTLLNSYVLNFKVCDNQRYVFIKYIYILFARYRVNVVEQLEIILKLRYIYSFRPWDVLPLMIMTIFFWLFTPFHSFYQPK